MGNLRSVSKALERVVADGGLELVGQHRSTQREGRSLGFAGDRPSR